MITLSLKFQYNTPQYSLDKCTYCESLEGISYSKIENRGCCFYYPKFSLLDLQKMCKSQLGLDTLNKILSNPGTEIYKYYIHCKGYFDEKKYDNYFKNYLFTDEEYDFPDKTIFFRTCPFVTPNEGCSLPPEYRTDVCNFFICKSIYDAFSKLPQFNLYIKERNSYMRWIQWENEGLLHLLNQQNLNLVHNFHDCIELLKKQPLNTYEFPSLPPITFNNIFNAKEA